MGLSTGQQWAAAAPALLVLAYFLFIAVLAIPPIQRQILYLHKIKTWHDISRPEIFGFAKNQIRSLTIPTPDGQTLYAWHILPFDAYHHHRSSVTSSPRPDPAFFLSLLRSDPQARVLISFHGNAGHIAQAWRTDFYRSCAHLPHTHILALDYRGFGRSTGSPSEPGLITDGIAAATLVLREWGISPSRVALVGHSLGTAVASAVTLHFASPGSALLPKSESTSDLLSEEPPTLFAGTCLIAPFTSLPNLLLTYRAAGVVPMLQPFRFLPGLHSLIYSLVREKWRSADRLAAFRAALADVEPKPGSGRGTVHILHAVDDADIPCKQAEMLFGALTGEKVPWPDGRKGACRAESEAAGMKTVVEFVERGGHDRVTTYAEVWLALREILDIPDE